MHPNYLHWRRVPDGRKLPVVLLVALLGLSSAGCYSVVLEPIPAQIASPHIPVAATIDIPPTTAAFQYVVRSGMAGGANSWTIEVGGAIVQYADAYLSNAFDKGSGVTVQIDMQHFDVHDFEAHCSLQFTVHRGSAAVFQKTYEGQGVGYAARVIWGGAFAMKSSMRRTTDEALRSIFTQFITDAQAQYTTWSS